MGVSRVLFPGQGSSSRILFSVFNVLTGTFVSITLHFKDHKGNPIKTIEATEGDDILSLAHEWDIDLEGTSFLCAQCLCFLPNLL